MEVPTLVPPPDQRTIKPVPRPPGSRLWRAVLLGAALAGSLPVGKAVTADWSPVSNISAESDVQTDGRLVGAWSFRNASATPRGTALSPSVTVNGVPFTSITNVAGAGQLAISVGGGGAVSKAELGIPQLRAGAASVTPYSKLPAAYQSLLAGTFAVFQQGTKRPMSLTISGLTENKIYSVQLWVSWSNETGFSGETAFTIDGAMSPPLDSNTTNANGGLGQYVTGFFVTGPGETSVQIVASSENASFPGGSNACVNISALQIREVDKYAWFKNAKYGLGIAWNIPYPEGVTGVPQGGPDGPAFSEFVRIKTEQGDDRSQWAKVVDNFDVQLVADQAARAGAGYVIFAVGGSTGLYVSWNAEYESSQQRTHGPFIRGEFTSKRDLISDLADALNAKGIRLFVYLPAEGPLRDYYLKRPGELEMYPSIATHARDGLLDEDKDGRLELFRTAYSDEFRAKYHAMLAEWSDRWKSKVAGWWVDGVFAEGGYRRAENASNGDPTGNLNALIAAMKHGNPQALVAVNPRADVLGAISETQDYTAGELGMYSDGRGKFYEYPYQQFTSFDSNSQINNHYYSYLGTWWNTYDRKYVDDEIINYISSVSDKGGVLSICVAADGTGHISDLQMAQLERIKAAIKPNVVPATLPKPIVHFTNLALYKPAWLMRHRHNYGDPHLLPGVGYQKQPHAAVDGDSKTFAMPNEGDEAGYTFGHSFLVDLESEQSFDRVAVTFPENRFSTSYMIEYSSTGLADSWSPLDSGEPVYSNSEGGLKVHEADRVKSGRYLRISSAQPDWPSKPGYMMGVQEFAVFNVSGSLPATKEVVWVDEEFPTGATVTTAGAASWQTASTLDINPKDPDDPANWAKIAATGVPHPQDGVKLHWNKAASGPNEHGFSGSVEPLRVGTRDILYCDVYLDPVAPTSEILLKWTDSTGSEKRARWGANSLPPGGASMGPLPAKGQWTRLYAPAAALGLGGKTLAGMSFATYGGRTFFDRAGKVTP